MCTVEDRLAMIRMNIRSHVTIQMEPSGTVLNEIRHTERLPSHDLSHVGCSKMGLRDCESRRGDEESQLLGSQTRARSGVLSQCPVTRNNNQSRGV